MPIHREHFYAQVENDLLVLKNWAEGICLPCILNGPEVPKSNKDVSYNYELIIEMQLENKQLIKSLFELVDKNAFKASLDLTYHYKEGLNDGKTGGFINKEKQMVA